MELRVLGPMQVAAADGNAELASGKQVALLACLLVAGGDVVSRDRLIDALWGEQPPAAAVNALQVHVHQLRRRLGPGRIELEGPGYRLRLAPGELDLERFERLVARGRAELSRGEAAAAESSLREALGLWPGQPYEDVRYEASAQAEVARLEALRLAALEDRIEAEPIAPGSLLLCGYTDDGGAVTLARASLILDIKAGALPAQERPEAEGTLPAAPLTARPRALPAPGQPPSGLERLTLRRSTRRVATRTARPART